METVEVSTLADPSTYIAFSAMDYDLYRRLGDRDGDVNVFLTQYAVSCLFFKQ